MSNRTKFKMQRAQGLELPGLGKPGAPAMRSYPPRQHGQSKTKNLSGFDPRQVAEYYAKQGV
jgi:small subunit ribosomal protein S4